MTAAPTRLKDAAWALPVLAGAEILYTDLDYTLFGRGGSLLTDLEGRPIDVAARAVTLLNVEALAVVPVTGRNTKQMGEIGRLLGWRDWLAEVGCVLVHDRGAEVRFNLGDWTPGLVEAAGVTPYGIIERSGAMKALLAAFPGKLEYHEPYHLDRLVTHILRGQIDLAAAEAVLDTFDPPLAIVDNGVIRPWKHTLVGVDRIHSYHVMPRGVTKVHAILGDLEERGLKPSQALGAGDSLTDLRMAPAVGLLALVRNALEHPEMTERAAGYDNVVVTDGACGVGWAELAHAWVDARANASCGVH